MRSGARMSNAATLPPSRRLTPSSRAKRDQRAGRCVVALRQRQHLAGLEGQVPAPVADPFGLAHLRLQRRARRRAARRAPRPAAPRPGPETISMPLASAGGDRLELVPGRVDQHQPAGLAQHRVRRALDDVDHQRVGQLARDPRVLRPTTARSSSPRSASRSTSGIARSRSAEHALVDLELVHPLDPATSTRRTSNPASAASAATCCLRQRGHARRGWRRTTPAPPRRRGSARGTPCAAAPR